MGEGQGTPQRQDEPDSLKQSFAREISKLSTPELEERKANRRKLQQRGYAYVLQEVLRMDGLSSLFSYVRLMAQLDLSLPQDQLIIYSTIRIDSRETPGLPGFYHMKSSPMGIPLHEPREFPRDPWRKK
jgi:hypothetical protein